MRDFHEIVRSFADQNRKTLIKSLRNAADLADRAAHSGSQEKRYEARRQSERFGRILYFLLHDTHSNSATADDIALCRSLKEKLQSVGQWRDIA